jgi:hypothetical protein
MQVVVFLCGGREPGATNIAEMANYMSLCTGDDVKNIVVKHFDENDIAKLIVKGAIGQHESKPMPKDEDKEDPIRCALSFISEHFPRNGRTDIELGFDLQRELTNAKARIAMNYHSANAQDKALVNAVDILCTFEVNPNDLRKYGISKSTLGIIRYVAKQV